jgi:aquaporin Z
MKRYLAEAIGTFVLVLGGVGSAVLAGDKIGNIGVALAFGLSLLAMVYTIGPISGCHINPAVTIGAYLAGRIAVRDALAYVAAQITGSVVGAAVLLWIAKGSAAGYSASAAGLGANGFADHSPAGYSLFSALIAEIVLTAFLVLTVLASTDPNAPAGFAGIAIGLVLTLIHLVSIPVTNTSVNPARSIGPALFVRGWALQQLWLFIVAPVMGACVGAAAFEAIRMPLRNVAPAQRGDGSAAASRKPESIGHAA